MCVRVCVAARYRSLLAQADAKHSTSADADHAAASMITTADGDNAGGSPSRARNALAVVGSPGAATAMTVAGSAAGGMSASEVEQRLADLNGELAQAKRELAMMPALREAEALARSNLDTIRAELTDAKVRRGAVGRARTNERTNGRICSPAIVVGRRRARHLRARVARAPRARPFCIVFSSRTRIVGVVVHAAPRRRKCVFAMWRQSVAT